MIYYIGCFSSDAHDQEWKDGAWVERTPEGIWQAEQVAKLRDRYQELQVRGEVTLSQRRIGPGRFEYIATPVVHPKGQIACAGISREQLMAGR